MAAEGAVGRGESAFLRRMRERVGVWRRLFLQNWNLFKASRIGVVGLGIMVAFVILALAAPFMGLRDPVRTTAPEQDLIAPKEFWRDDTSLSGSDFPPNPPPPAVSQPIAFRMQPRNFDPRADRIYAVAENRVYALATSPSESLRNAWRALQYMDVRAYGAPSGTRTVSAPPVAANFGAYDAFVPDYETYIGTDDGLVLIFRDTLPGGNDPPFPITMQLDGPISGLGVFNGDIAAPTSVQQDQLRIQGNGVHVWYNGTQWLPETLGGVGDVGQYASIVTPATGSTVYFAYYSFVSGQPVVSVRTNGVWSFMKEIEPFSAATDVGRYTSLAVGSDGRPRLAYYDLTSRTLKYAAWDGTSQWVISVVSNAGFDIGQYASLALDSADAPHVAYFNASARRLEYATSPNGVNWTIEVPDGSLGTTGTFASLALDPLTDSPRIAYHAAAAGSLKFAEWNGVWTNVTVDAGPVVGEYASLALDPLTREPSIAYYNATGASLMYAARSGTWSSVVVDRAARPDLGDYGRFASLAFDRSAVPIPAIAYHDAANLTLRYARLNGSAWDRQTVLSGGNDGLYASLKFDAANRPHIGSYSFGASRTRADLLVVGTRTGMLYAIDLSIPGVIVASPREQRVSDWRYQVRWVVDLGSEVHLAAGPMAGSIPLYSPCFSEDGAAIVAGTLDGVLHAIRASDGMAWWPGANANGVRVSDPGAPRPWMSAPIVDRAAEGPERDTQIVYAGAPLGDRDGDGQMESVLYALNGSTGDPIREWASWRPFDAYGDAAPVNRSLGVADGGDVAQPFVESGQILVGTANGSFYGLRRDGAGLPTDPSFLAPGSVTWRFSDATVEAAGFTVRFTSAPFVLIDKLIILVAGNNDNGTANPTDDAGTVYAIKMNGALTWAHTVRAPIAGSPAAWQAPASIDPAVWIGYGGPRLTGVRSMWADGEFLAPSEPSWAHTYACPIPADEARRCPGYRSGNVYWLGLDSQGRDIFSQVIWGSRIALLVGFLSAFFTVVLGVVVGLIAGYVGGKVESVLMRFTDVILVLPGLPLIITLAAVLGASIWNIILVISLLGWPPVARIIRAEVLSLKERPFIDSARVTGASTTRIVFRHIAPNVMPLAFLYMTFSVSGAILTEAALSFIGLGDISTMSWGIMLQLVSQSRALQAWWWLLPPGLAITLISLAFFLVGRAFDEIVNPRLRKR